MNNFFKYDWFLFGKWDGKWRFGFFQFKYITFINYDGSIVTKKIRVVQHRDNATENFNL